MASFIRFGVIRALNNNLTRSISTNRPKSLSLSLTRCINTSSKPPQASSAVTPTANPANTKTLSEIQDDKSENWVSYGFDEEDKWWDRFLTHSTFFMSVSVCLVLGGTLIAYMPDLKENEWTTREAYLRLRYREENGLPLIDPNYVDPSKLVLPSDEELGDTEIII